MASVKNETNISLKMLVDTMANKVLFAEAGKDFVDFIFHIMSLPLGSVAKILNHENMVGSIGDIYRSVESLSSKYFLSVQNRDSVLNPKATVSVPLLSLNDAPSAAKSCYYKCSSGWACPNITDCRGTKCPSCGCGICTELKYMKPKSPVNAESSSSENEQGCVKGLVTYMVMDNLEVKPMSTISGFALINKLNVKDVLYLEEIEVQVGLNEGLRILKASLETKEVLTTVFLGQKIKSAPSFFFWKVKYSNGQRKQQYDSKCYKERSI